jgi:hypothetical protein
MEDKSRESLFSGELCPPNLPMLNERSRSI